MVVVPFRVVPVAPVDSEISTRYVPVLVVSLHL